MSSNNEDSEEIHSEESVEDPKRQCRNIGIDRVFCVNYFVSFTSFIFHPPSSFLNITFKTDLFSWGRPPAFEEVLITHSTLALAVSAEIEGSFKS